MKFRHLTFGPLLLLLLDCRPAAPAASTQAMPPASAPVAAAASPSGSWLAIDQTSDAPAPSQLKLEDEVVASFFEDETPKNGGYTYAYGGRTRNKRLPSSTPGNAAVFATYFDDDYSGVNISLGNAKFVDLTPYRKTGSLTFWVKAGPHAQKFMVGLMDNQGGPKKVQSKVVGDAWVVAKQGEWTQCRIPLKAFIDDGSYWDEKQGREIGAKLDWTKITDFRISINRGENKIETGTPVIFYLDQIQLTKTAKGVVDPDAYWDAFNSNAPQKVLTDFTQWAEQWHTQHGNSADVSAAVSALPPGAPGAVKGRALKVDFKPGDWSDVFIRPDAAQGLASDFSKHYGLSLWLYSEKPYQAFDFVIHDRGGEMFTARAGASRGWHQILIPFRAFTKFPYYQPPQATQNNKLDLDGVTQLGIKPAGEVPATLYLASLEITNQRELTKPKAPSQLVAKFSGDSSKPRQAIPDIYGINVGSWEPDLLAASSLPLEKALGLGVVRYPGGLHADEEDWQKTLKAKDGNVDTDEFLDWCDKQACTPMFTANVGDGTPEMAAAWVDYVNHKRKGPKVKLWEIGNEIYGDWHRYYAKWGKDGGVAYGKAVRAYVKAMKAADPTIKISAVWTLGGPWNRAVFKEAADVVDAVSVHHYAQGSGSESDEGLLASSGEVDGLLRDVKKQVDELGTKGKTYEVWLTEWNSVDGNPGPQILSHVEGLFVADYLGHLASSPIQIGNLWALYNGRDKRLGDYSLLAPAGDPQGDNFRRPAYWAFSMLSSALRGTLLTGATDQEALSGFLTKHADGKLSLVFVNKSLETDFQTTLRVPGLKGNAMLSTLTAEMSGGIAGHDAMGKTFPSTGPRTERRDLSDGATILVPKASIVTITY